MQVLEEAKHFVVLRELLHAFDVPIPRQSVWEYLLLERVHKAEGLDKLFGMNIVVEGIALSLFGMMSNMPGLEILRLFHLDESRHSALPVNYLSEFPMTWWQKNSPARRINRLRLLLPAVPLIAQLEEPAARLGIDSLDLGGSVIRKVAFLSERSGFYLPVNMGPLVATFNQLFNIYRRATRGDNLNIDYSVAETTLGRVERRVEEELFGPSPAVSQDLPS